MKRCYYFQDVHPLIIYHFGDDNYYVTLRQLAMCLRVSVNKVFTCINRKHTVNFAQLQLQNPTTPYTLYPSTLMIHVARLSAFMSKFCDSGQTKLFYEFLKKCFLDDNKHLNKHYMFDKQQCSDEKVSATNVVDTVLCVYGLVLEQNIHIFSYNNKTYYHATDVARYIKCTPSYCINKYVDDENMVLWCTLKRYMLNNFVCVNFKNCYKNNTIFLKKPGVTQLTMAVCGNNNLLCELEQSKMVEETRLCWVGEGRRRRRLKPHKTLTTASECCVVGRLTNKTNFGFDYLVTAVTKNVFFKLRQITQAYGLRINTPDQYHHYLIRWQTLKQKLNNGPCNINWKPNLIMVESVGVYKMLCDANLIAKANQFMYSTVNEIKNKCEI
ncbi:Clas83 [Clostera anastomosis granulovirus B]|uniref:Clas83 n=1 Tax=Clostera anastomosis granulovirus B TaxID=1986290 RepID=A0A0K0WS99_9BBAC|nr:Clas83 [Clostera anastomosis granulovirus B]AKS25426.1 Clas83 [Clostera anastomosis granulovirus B]